MSLNCSTYTWLSTMGSDIPMWLRAPREKELKQTEVYSFSNLALEIGAASLSLYYIAQSSYRAYLDYRARGYHPVGG